jgi:hypothetical protein
MTNCWRVESGEIKAGDVLVLVVKQVAVVEKKSSLIGTKISHREIEGFKGKWNIYRAIKPTAPAKLSEAAGKVV